MLVTGLDLYRLSDSFSGMYRYLTALLLIIFLSNCSTHSTIPVVLLEEGQSTSGYAFSIENVFPYYYYQRGISDYSSIGFRIGLPIYGSGIDWNRVLFKRENRWDLLSLSWSLNHNPNIDFTYYKVRSRIAANGNRTTFWLGFREMYIPLGISGNTSSRIGMVLGTTIGSRLGLELGYCHDFSAMPIGQLFAFNWQHDSPKNINSYGDKPHIDASGMPSEYSRLTGLSLKLSLRLSKDPNGGYKD